MRIVITAMAFVLSISTSLAQDSELVTLFNFVQNMPLKMATSKAADQFVAALKDNVDIAEAALLLENEANPDINIKKYLNQLDEMVKDVQARIGNNNNPRHRINTLRVYLFSVFGMSYDFSDPYAQKRSNKTLSGILDTKKGTCSTMPLLFLVLAQKLGWPVYPVLLPNHFFVRYIIPPSGKYNLEVTSDGDIFHDDDYYIKNKFFNITQRGINSGSYLRTLTNKEFLTILFSYHAQFFFFDKAKSYNGLKYIEVASRLNKAFANTYLVKASMWDAFTKFAKRVQNPELEARYSSYADTFRKAASVLGFTKPDPVQQKQYLMMISNLEKQQVNNKGPFLY